MTRTPLQCCRLTPTKMEGTKVPEWRISKSSLIELVGETGDAVDAAAAAVGVGVLVLPL
jgi:hypothetical protein